MEINSILILFFFGIFGGFLSGLLGVGGGIIFIPILTYFLKQLGLEDDELVKYILANSLGTILFAGIISTYKQYKLQQFYPKQILLTASLAMITSYIVTSTIVDSTWYTARYFNFFFLALLVFTLLRFWFVKSSDAEVTDVPSGKYLVTGFLTGTITAISGLGGGIIMIPLFTQYLKLNIKKAASISIGVIPLIILPILLKYGSTAPNSMISDSQIGYILPMFIFPVIAGLVFAAPFGVVMGQKLSNKVLKIIFACLVGVVIVNTIGNIITS